MIENYINNFDNFAIELLIFARDNQLISKKEFEKSMKMTESELIIL